MRIAISGSANQGKTTVVNDFIKNWPKYTKSRESWKKLITPGFPLSKKATQESQWKILNAIVDDLQMTRKGDNVIFDRCALDNIVYSIWSLDKQLTDIDDKFVEKCIPIVRESMKFLDIIFFIPITKVAPVAIAPKENRETDEEYIAEVDNIFKAIEYQYQRQGASPFMPPEDRPPIIEIFGTPEQRIEIMKLYIDPEGEAMAANESVLDVNNLEKMAQLLREQQAIKKEETKPASPIIIPRFKKPSK